MVASVVTIEAFCAFRIKDVEPADNRGLATALVKQAAADFLWKSP
jgi:hypothetical protein